jgi:ABC-type uncharacterized transport system substrate-binding protein
MAKKKKKSGKSKSSAKSKAKKTIGILHSGRGNDINKKSIKAFIDELGYYGYEVNQNLTLDPPDPLWSNDDLNLLANNAQTLARNSKLDLIIAAGGPSSVYAILDAQNAEKTNTNVVFTSFSQLTKPACNMTGVGARTSELDSVRLALLNKLAPGQTTFGVLENQSRKDYDRAILQCVATRLKFDLNRVNVVPCPTQTIIDSINAAFKGWSEIKPKPIKFALVAADPLFNDFRSVVIEAETDNDIGAMHQWKEFKDEGGLAAHGTDLIEAYQKAGIIAVKVLDGTDPTEIEVQPLTNVASSINLATAQRLGLKIPSGWA